MKNSSALETHVRIGEIFKILRSWWPDAQCELVFHTPFQLLIAVVLSAQTTDKAVNKALAPLLTNQPPFSPHTLLEMGEKNFLEKIRSIGLAPTKARNCCEIARIILEKYEGNVPLEREILESLPGVGRKTANVILNVLLNLPVIAVDTHVERVSQRMGLVLPTRDRLKIEKGLLEVVPSEFLAQAHHLLIFHGRYHCTAKKPQCVSCPVNHLCIKTGLKE